MASGYDGFAVFNGHSDDDIYFYDRFGLNVHSMSGLSFVNEDCTDTDGIFDIDGTFGDIFVLTSCGSLTKVNPDYSVDWNIVFTNDTDQRYLKSNENHVLVTNTTHFTLYNSDDGSLNVSFPHSYTVYPSNVALTKDSTLLIAERNIDTIIELDIIEDDFINQYSPYFLEQVYSLSYDPVNETIFILHGKTSSGTYSGGQHFFKYDTVYSTLINRNFETVWSFHDTANDQTVTNYNMNYDALFHCTTGDISSPYVYRQYSFNDKHYIVSGGSISGNSFCTDGWDNVRTAPGGTFISTFDTDIMFPLDENTAESHYISDYTDIMSEQLKDYGRYDYYSSSSSNFGLDRVFFVLDGGNDINNMVGLLYTGSGINITISYPTGYTGYQLIKSFEAPYSLYTVDDIRVSPIHDIQTLTDDDIIGADVTFLEYFEQFYATTTDTIRLNMSDFFFNYTDVDISFFNSDAQWLVTLDTGIDEPDAWYNDSAVNYSLYTSGDSLVFKVDPFAYYEGEHLNSEVVVQAYRNDSNDFAEQRFDLIISRDEYDPESVLDTVEVIGDPQDITVGYDTTVSINLEEIYSGSNTYVVEWFERDTGNMVAIPDTIRESNKVEVDQFIIWFGYDNADRFSVFIRSKQSEFKKDFTIYGMNEISGFGIADVEETAFTMTVESDFVRPDDQTEENIIDQIIPDAQRYDSRGRWIWAIAIIVIMTALFYVITEGNVGLAIMGAMLGFISSVALGFIPVVIIVFIVILVLGFIFLRARF